MYEPFFTTKAPNKSTGLGLSTIRSILEDQGGHILCSSTSGGETSFVINIALASTDETDVDQNKTASILLIDSEEVMRNPTRSILEYNGYQTLVTRDGKEGIETFRQHQPDVVLLDLSMPDMSVNKVFTTIRQINPNAKILIFMETGNELDALSLYADTPIIRKPYLASNLVYTIEQITNA